MAGIVITPFAGSAANFDISAQGFTDWAIFNGASTGGTVAPGQRKSGGGSLIGSLTTPTTFSVGWDTFTRGGGPTITWSGGTPTASGANANGIYSLEASASVTVVADTTVREVYYYAGNYRFDVTLTASLSDGSAGPAVDTSMVAGSNGWWKVTYSAASAGQTLTLATTHVSTGSFSDYEPWALGVNVLSSGTSVAPGVGSIALTGYAPTVARTANQAVAPGVGSIALAGFVPTVARTASVALVPAVASLALAGYAPTVTQGAGQAVNPGAASVTLTGYAPAVTQSASQTVLPGVGSIVLSGFAPTVARTANQAVAPGVGSLALTGCAPAVTVASASVSLVPGAASLTVTGYAPGVAQSSGGGGVDSWGSVYARKKKKPEQGVAGPLPGPTLRETIESAVSSSERKNDPPKPTFTEQDDEEDEALMLLL